MYTIKDIKEIRKEIKKTVDVKSEFNMRLMQIEDLLYAIEESGLYSLRVIEEIRESLINFTYTVRDNTTYKIQDQYFRTALDVIDENIKTISFFENCIDSASEMIVDILDKINNEKVERVKSEESNYSIVLKYDSERIIITEYSVFIGDREYSKEELKNIDWRWM